MPNNFPQGDQWLPNFGLAGRLHRLSVKLSLAVLALVVTAGPAWALDPHRALTQALLRKWQFQQGLPQPTIFKIQQTSDGYLWLGTPAGLYRFDGIRFSAAPEVGNSSLKSLWIQDLCEDRNHGLWIAANEAGLVRIKDGKAVSYGLLEGLPSTNVRCLLMARSGDLWVGTDNGAARCVVDKLVADNASRDTSDRSPFVRVDLGTGSNDVYALCETLEGTIWWGGDGDRLGVWDGAAHSSRTLTSLPARGSVRALLSDPDGSVWVGSTAGLVHISGSGESIQEKRITRVDGLPDDSIDCLTRSRDGSLWVGTKDGICRLQGKDFEVFRTRDGLSQSTVFTICEDHEGSIWVGTKHGLNQFVDRRILPITMSEGLPSNDTGAVLQDQAGAVWVGTLGKGLARYDGRRCVLAVDAAHGLLSDTILSLADGGSGDLWIGTDRGLCRLRDGQIEERFSTENGLPSNVVACLCRDDRGVLWAGTSAGLAELSEGRFVQPQGDGETLRSSVLALVDCGKHGLVAATEGGGLLRCVNRQLRPDGKAGELPNDVNAFYKDQDGLLWMGTRGSGMALLTGEKLSHFTVKDGLFDDEVFGIVADNEDRLWMACSRGIFFVSRAEFLKFAAGEIARLTSTPFSPTDAQRTIACQAGVEPAVWKMQDGQIWFSTDHGVLVVDPANMRRVLPPPPVQVEEVQVNGQEVNPGQIPEIPPGRTNLYFRYAALSFASPSRITFRHRLEGFDKSWIEAGARREAFYTNLPPGSYRFRVSAANLDGPWNEAAHTVEFTLDPSVYQRRWFLPLVAGMLLISGWIALRLRVLQVKARLNAVLAERSRIARELHDTLIQGFSGVTMQMQALAARLRLSPERKTLDEIIQDAGHCLREARLSVGGLRSAPGNTTGLADAVGRAARQLTETRDVRLSLRLEECPLPIPVDVEYNLLRIVQEAITNAVRHSGARTIEVAMDCTPQNVRLMVQDDGVGFVVLGRDQSAPGHYGLIGMRERASQINAILQLDSQPGLGTTVRLDLGLSASNAVPLSAATVTFDDSKAERVISNDECLKKTE